MTETTAQRIKLYIYASPTPVLLLRVARFLTEKSIPVELGNTFVKFIRGDAQADQAAAALKEMGFKVLTSVDDFLADTDQNLKARSAAALEIENTPKGHVHGRGCGHDHHDHDHKGQGHSHDHSHDHDHHPHDHGHSHDHDHKH